MNKPKLVLLVVIDCLRADRLSGTGYRRLTSPILDSYAARGTRFTACYPQGIYTFPSHTSLLTGVHHATHRLSNGDTFEYALPTVADYFAAAGYQTAGFVSNGMLAGDMGLGDAFGLYDDGLAEGTANPKFSRDAAATTEAVMAWLEMDSAESRFLFVHYNDCHGPIRPPAAYRDLFVDDAFYIPGAPLPLGRGRGVIPSDYALEGHTEPGYYAAQYDAAIRYIDDQLGRLLARLQTQWAWDDMLVLVTGDHGEGMGEHGIYFAHGKGFYEEFIRTPLWLFGGAVPARGLIEQPIQHIDVLPTLLEALQMGELPAHLQGRSLWPWLRGQATAQLADLFDFHQLSAYIRQGDWKYITTLDYTLAPRLQPLRRLLRRRQEELYDLAADPAEQMNQIGRQRALARQMRALMLARLTAYAAASPAKRAPGATPHAAEADIQQRMQALGYVE